LHNLDACAPGWDGDAATAVVLGAGGAARAVIYGLLERGTRRIIAVNRSQTRAQDLQARFGPRVHIAGWNEGDRWLAEASLLVNATTLGMQGEPDLVLDIARLPERAIVTDLVYVPLVTPLLRAARARGLRTADGLGMLMHQAVRGFHLWFGGEPEITNELRGLVESDLSARPPPHQE
jgi:shikimate dehydrogenase